jgi:RNA polymerase sigma-70 factor (ECF subfamily)
MSTTEPNEAALVARLRAGDGEAYAEVFRTYTGPMTAVARGFFGDHGEAADAVQDAFVSAYRGLPGYAGTARLGTWLHRVTVNACLMRLRARRRRRTVPLDEPTLARGRRPRRADSGDHPVRRLDRAESAARVRACVERLPAAYREVIRLRDLEELDTDETAARLGTNAGVVKTRLHRARHALRVLLESQ